ncbi:MAG: hypothetical protein KGN79_00170, partial [Acidobacteriota bacterium]|nr:hypothetical protein [Acidobacteriota bacterium]
WMSEMRTTIAGDAAPGAPGDPRPEANVGKDLDTVVDMQSIVSIFNRNPGFYNPVSYGIIGSLLLVWTLISLRSQAVANQAWLAIAAAAALTPLFAYHREHDTKLLLLCIPACIGLWAARGALGWTAMILTTTTIALNGDLTQIARIMLIEPHVSYQPGFIANITAILFGRPAQLSLLILGVFYLLAFMRQLMRGANADRAQIVDGES